MVIPSALDLAQLLIARESVTPSDGGCLAYLFELLQPLGFSGEVVTWNDTSNLFLRWGRSGKHLCFAGHVDVVPPGDIESWNTPPFKPTIKEQRLYGRGVADMKGAVAVFVVALMRFLEKHGDSMNQGSCSLLLTSDEEGPGIDGIPRMMPWLKEKGQVPDYIVLGEPTGSGPGQVLQVGRRGSVTARLTCYGKQGHIAYPEHTDNPIPRMIRCLDRLMKLDLDGGPYPSFQASHLQVTSIDVGNPVMNITPGHISARWGCRFNPSRTCAELESMFRQVCEEEAGHHSLEVYHNGEPFITKDRDWIDMAKQAIQDVTGVEPPETTHGATTDGRFLIHMAPVICIGFAEDTIHQVNENAPLDHFTTLEKIYSRLLERFFAVEK